MAKTRYVLEAQDKVTPELRKIQKEMKQFADGFKTIGKGIAGAFAFDKLKDFGIQAFTVFAEKEVVLRRFDETLRRAGITSKEVGKNFNELADKLEATAGIDGDQVLNLASSYITLGRSADDVYKLTQVAADLAAVTGDDLATSMSILTKADAGQIAKLKLLIPELNALTDAQIANGEAVDLIASKVDGMSDKIYGGAIGSVNSLKKSWEDFTEAVGRNLANSGIVQWLADVMSKAADLQDVMAGFDQGKKAKENAKSAIGREAIQATFDKNQAAIEYAKKAKSGNFDMIDITRLEKEYGMKLKGDGFGQVSQSGLDALIKKLEAQNQGNQRLLDNMKRTSGELTKEAARSKAIVESAPKQTAKKTDDSAAKNLAKEWEEATMSFDLYRAYVVEGYQQIGAEVDSETEAIDQAWRDSVDSFNQTKDAVVNGVNAIASAIGGVWSAWMDLENQRSQAVLANYDRELKALEDKYNAESQAKKDLGLSTAEIDQQYEKQKDDLEKQRLQKENEFAEKSFNANKANTLASIVMQTANAVVGALGSFPYGPWNIALASGIGALGAAQFAIASQAQYTPKFADGGIVGGNSTYGDRILARVNSGEMVLNASQQAQLFDMANGRGRGASVSIVVNGAVGSPSEIALALGREIDKQRILGNL